MCLEQKENEKCVLTEVLTVHVAHQARAEDFSQGREVRGVLRNPPPQHRFNRWDRYRKNQIYQRVVCLPLRDPGGIIGLLSPSIPNYVIHYFRNTLDYIIRIW